MSKNRIIVYIIYILIGAALLGLGCAEIVDAFWSGMGSALLIIGAIQLLRLYRLSKNEVYREKMQIEHSDERNRFIRGKAWSWAGYMFVLIASAACIVLRIMGENQLSLAASSAVCLMMLLFWICYLVLKRKY